MERVISPCTRVFSRTVQPLTQRSIAPLRLSRATSRPSSPAYSLAHLRCLHTSRPALMQSKPPRSRDRGPKSDEDTQTDFRELDVLRNTIAPATSIDACTHNGFALNNQVRISGSGILLIGGEAFRWWPWVKEGAVDAAGDMTGKLLNSKGQWEVQPQSWGVLELVYPKPGRHEPREQSGSG
jgi:NADH dehydrogenase [ubiquinone] 1 alpha subcomplex assembly factor 3